FTDRKRQAQNEAPADSAARMALADSVIASVWALENKVIAIESKLYDINLTGAREDAFRNPNQLFEKLLSLASDVGASGAAFRATDQHREVAAMLQRQLTDYKAQFERLLAGDVVAYNKLALERGAPTISVKSPPRPVVQ